MMIKPEDERFADNLGRSARALSDYMGLGLQIAASFAFFVMLGYWADSQFATSPWLFLLGVLVGMFGMALLLMKVVRSANKGK